MWLHYKEEEWLVTLQCLVDGLETAEPRIRGCDIFIHGEAAALAALPGLTKHQSNSLHPRRGPRHPLIRLIDDPGVVITWQPPYLQSPRSAGHFHSDLR